MGAGLEHPAVAGVAGLEVLELAVVELVDGTPIGLGVDPVLVGRHPKLVVEQRGAHRLPHQHDAFLGQLRAHRVDRVEAGQLHVAVGHRGRALGDTRVGVEGGGLGRRRREHHLPRHRCPAARVAGEDVVQDRGARPGHADDEHRAHDLLRRDLREALAVLDIVEAVDRVQQHPFVADDAPDVVELSLGRQRIDEAAQALHERTAGSVTQVIEPAGPLRRGTQHPVDVERLHVVCHRTPPWPKPDRTGPDRCDCRSPPAPSIKRACDPLAPGACR